ncbi:hypothetical protein CHS0354_020973 [Potamilus streckersoni]|uniref:VTT domain-containing protein n=1 Tax=Potamilus streckersoni TaxID=2493646 RepID=A0AAE0SYU9_9BIVA|nr:hypothetical protein CHS0354_020973 [Potamilus streckersoni]
MAFWSDGLSKFHAKELLIGESSKVEQVFLSDHAVYGHNELVRYLDALPKPSANIIDNHILEQLPATNRRQSCYRVFLTSIFVISIICTIVILCRDHVKNLLLWLEKVDTPVSFSIFVILFSIVSFPIAWGFLLLILAAGYLYGFVYGSIVVATGGAVGVTVAHLTMKKCCRVYIMTHFYNENVTPVIRVVEGVQGFKVVALTRLTPIPFGLQNGLFSLTNISLLPYVAASVMGLLPFTFLNCYIGSTLRSMEDVLTDESNQTTGYIIFIVQIIFTIALMWFVVRKARAELKKTVEEEGVTSPEVI